MVKKEKRREQLTIGGKQVTVYKSVGQQRPVIYLHNYRDDGGQIDRALRERGCPDCTLAVISGLVLYPSKNTSIQSGGNLVYFMKKQ